MKGIAFAFFYVLMRSIGAYNTEMTTTIDAGSKLCFFHSVKLGETIDLDYQVIDGGHGDLDVSFELFDPMSKVIFVDYKRSDNIHRHEAKVSGDYKFCFDNTFSSFSRKTVFFELIVEKDGEVDEENKWEDFEGLRPEEVYDMKVQDIQESIVRIRTHLTRARQLQDLLRSFEARDRNVAEENYFKVNAWSFFQVVAMVAVGTIQVIMVRSLFDTNSKVHKIWTKLS
ncbi:transmembrane emp24 domain-containing protein 5 [Phlebotomus argentipes]|uniref:transmembrane emp24 domain-containing protein 5 n=1 Tax=Phlebotomus argentipes TaxID=94469 RepID=UPI002892DA3C|nr:transmembrane emp24 domain-containing protein 5 [Phlebotomus argentipes]